ncbi:MAG: sigma-70 family RNA polymerase sigma factor [Myxococcales bacterium]|nr:sigma-70 family RNA polymerase sigma factor [Myxococcales bacterium]MBK7197778.1 sigma-70 family RNA polymerase sigma factor [Myxococcales bacterium]MBP6848583.1 sigma-70 family RNA polymerase sigma factor [Kofleriaceae bacterium]
MADDWELLAAWRAGDAAAGNALVAAHFESVSRFFRGKLGDDVEDVLQQTFLACVEGKDRIDGASFRSYLFGVATRRLFDLLRARYRAGRAVSFSEVSLADLGTTPSERVARNERAQLLQAALREIPLDAQIALELAYWEGLSGAEIAVTLEIEPGTVRSRLSRARDQLRDAVLALGGDAENLFGAAPAEAAD